MRSVSQLLKAKKVDHKVHSDGIKIGDKKYRNDEPESLPDEYSMKKAKTLQKGSGIYFQSQYSELSNMYPCKVLVGETMYSSSEQAYHHEYAVEAGDDVTAHVILEAEDGYECKKLAMRIQNPHPDWTNKKEAIMKTVLTAKFTQNEHLCQ